VGNARVVTASARPAFYAVSTGTGGGRDWVTLLHPPYTAWHLSYVALGAALAPRFALWRLAGTLVAFLLAVGVGAHALDELHGRPLGTGIPPRLLATAAALGIAVPVGVGWWYGGVRLLPFMVAGALLALSYDLELWHGRLHTTAGFALSWGAFPVLTGYYAQDFRLGLPAVVAAAGAAGLSVAQRELSLFARTLRRRAATVDGRMLLHDGDEVTLDRTMLLRAPEAALRAMTAGLVAVAFAAVLARSL
jgi:hypothetical protein